MVVKTITKGSPAELSGVKRGDIIVSADGNIFPNAKALIASMDNKHPGDHLILVINRNGQQINFEIETRMVKVPPTSIILRKLIIENKRVAIATIVSEVKSSFPNAPPDWADSMRNSLQSRYESNLLSGLGQYENFSVVDRSRLKEILNEFQFSQMGFVSDKLRLKIGEMTGATHILDISLSRFQSSTHGRDDMLNARLIEIESGKVLAVDQITTH